MAQLVERQDCFALGVADSIVNVGFGCLDWYQQPFWLADYDGIVSSRVAMPGHLNDRREGPPFRNSHSARTTWANDCARGSG